MNSSNPELGHSVAVHGIDTNCLIEGEGAPVVLLHGSGPGVTGYANWRLLLPRLAATHRVVAPDIVGFGYTARPENFDYTLDNWVDFIAGLLDALAIERAHFIGNSFGGGLSLAFAARHPSRVERLVLMGSAGLDFELTPGLDAVWGYQPSHDAMREVMKLFACNHALVSEEIVASRYQASIRPGYQECYAQLFPAPRQRHIRLLSTPEETLRQLPHRTLVIHGREDRIVPVACAERLYKLIPHADLHVFGECGHWTQVEKHEAFGDLVLRFLEAA